MNYDKKLVIKSLKALRQIDDIDVIKYTIESLIEALEEEYIINNKKRNK